VTPSARLRLPRCPRSVASVTKLRLRRLPAAVRPPFSPFPPVKILLWVPWTPPSVRDGSSPVKSSSGLWAQESYRGRSEVGIVSVFTRFESCKILIRSVAHDAYRGRSEGGIRSVSPSARLLPSSVSALRDLCDKNPSSVLCPPSSVSCFLCVSAP
jgi:hypothetical protein